MNDINKNNNFPLNDVLSGSIIWGSLHFNRNIVNPKLIGLDIQETFSSRLSSTKRD